MKLKQNDEGVSPVIGVILMVAVTVVLAAVVFVLVQRLAVPVESAPEIAFVKDSDSRTLTIATISEQIDWADLNVSGCTKPLDSGNVTAGEKLMACDGEITVVYTPLNSLLYATEF